MSGRCVRCGDGGLFIGASRICEGCRSAGYDPRDYEEVPEGAYPWPDDTVTLKGT
jgi:hypothetical protein